ncbi:uncharacterized protein isoform X5 [Danio rerio]|uniref:Uncharacterized protein isoform X5 n=1 Tax=Danio rerio TaxID=7955 RepID=A0AC58IC18_DANRE
MIQLHAKENRNESSTADLYKRKIFIVTTLTKKSKELVLVPLILKLYNGQQDQLFKRCVRGNTWSTYVEMLELQRRR